MEKIICRGNILQAKFTQHNEEIDFELITPTPEEVMNIEAGGTFLVMYTKNTAGHFVPAVNDSFSKSVVYIFPKTAQKDELEELKFAKRKMSDMAGLQYNPMTQISATEIMDKFDKLIDIVKEMKSK